MASVFRVFVPFTRKDPVNGEVIEYQRGDLIAHPDRIADIRGSEHDAHGHLVVLDDDHHAVEAVQSPSEPAEPAVADQAAVAGDGSLVRPGRARP